MGDSPLDLIVKKYCKHLEIYSLSKNEINNTNSKTSKSIYGFNPSTSEYKTWTFISVCTKFVRTLASPLACSLELLLLLI
jgi:hypothetical protein